MDCFLTSVGHFNLSMPCRFVQAQCDDTVLARKTAGVVISSNADSLWKSDNCSSVWWIIGNLVRRLIVRRSHFHCQGSYVTLLIQIQHLLYQLQIKSPLTFQWPEKLHFLKGLLLWNICRNIMCNNSQCFFSFFASLCCSHPCSLIWLSTIQLMGELVFWMQCLIWSKKPLELTSAASLFGVLPVLYSSLVSAEVSCSFLSKSFSAYWYFKTLSFNLKLELCLSAVLLKLALIYIVENHFCCGSHLHEGFPGLLWLLLLPTCGTYVFLQNTVGWDSINNHIYLHWLK